MIFFVSKYKIGSEEFSSFIVAKDWHEAEFRARERGIGETIVGQSDISDIESYSDVTDIGSLLHWVCFLSFIALESGKATPLQILGDRGVLHELVHFQSGSFDETTRKGIYRKVLWLFELTCVPHDPSIIDRILSGRK